MDYEILIKQIEALAEEANDPVPVLANASALLNGAMDDINWVGFYIVKDGCLVLGPFQGKPACVRIESGRGVCGTALATGKPQLVPDVHEFPGHIACDSASASEIVIPIRAADACPEADQHDTTAGTETGPRDTTADAEADPRDGAYGKIVAVLDIDSPSKGRFTQADLVGLEKFAATLAEAIDWK